MSQEIRRYEATVLQHSIFAGTGWRSEVLLRKLEGRQHFDVELPQHVVYATLGSMQPFKHSRIDGRRFDDANIRPGDAAIIPAESRFRGWTDENASVRYVALFLARSWLETLASDEPALHHLQWRPTTAFKNEMLKRLLTDVARETAGPSIGAGLALQSSLMGLLTVLLRREAVPLRGGLAPWRLRRVVDFVDSKFQTDITLDDLASAAGYSAYHFARAFKASLGVSPMRYVARRRTEAAKILLRSHLSIGEIARRLGYADQGRFASMFRRETGLTPAQYRQGT